MNIGIRPAALCIIVYLVYLAGAQCVVAFVHRLPSEQIRDAYSLGDTTNNAELEGFLRQYIRYFPDPPNGPYVQSIEFRTPFEQIVLRAREHLADYDEQAAERNYDAEPTLVVVRVLVYSTPTYPGTMRPPEPKSVGVWTAEDFLRGFRFVVAQKGSLRPKRMSRRLLCPIAGTCDFYDAYEVQLDFDSSQFTSGLASVTVTTPDGQPVEAKFDLDRLK